MAARKPSPPKKKPPASKPKPPAPKKAAAKKPPPPKALGNDPFARGAAVRAAVVTGGPPPRPHPVTPELQRASPSSKGAAPQAGAPSVTFEPKPHAGTPTAQPLSGATPHAGSPSVTFEPKPHAGTPTAQPLSKATAHAGSPSVTFEPKPHAGTPTAQPLSKATAHADSPSVTFDPKPHGGTPTAEPLKSATAHAGSPSVTFDPKPHAGTPTAQPLSKATAHADSPSVAFDPKPHAGTPTAQPLGKATAHAGSPTVSVDPQPHSGSPAVSAPVAEAPLARTEAPASFTSALKGLLGAARTSVGLSSRRTDVDRWGKDASLSASLRPLGELLYEKYWRVRVEGAEHLPTGPFIIVANHAGALPLDGPVLHLALRRERPDLPESRWLLEDQVFHAPFVGVLANRLGAVRASPENALRLLEEQRPLIVFPEGFHGLSKPFSERYRLRRFGRGGYVKIALRANVPIIPAAIVGGEESMPLLGKLPGGLLGVQYLPVTLPPLPARWHIRFGAPVSLSGAPSEPEHDLAWVERKNFEIRDSIEAMLTALLQQRTGVF